MIRSTALLVYATLLMGLVAGPAHASGNCKLALEPTTRGFFLNPTLEKVVVAKATPTTPGKPCVLQAGDELLQVNDQVISGANAKQVMAYWKGLPKDSERTFKVRRAGAILTLVAK
ncbi:MAG TPA: PDZ domain-containing protein [Frateuria sp.]|uniref:PDZ domain-containing protein n=1 Tax=Frateuria sp. TaxID=2211372 RepID=UPI002DE3273D|nr:PDZ domain-containing protein [Frateuria sp.]